MNLSFTAPTFPITAAIPASIATSWAEEADGRIRSDGVILRFGSDQTIYTEGERGHIFFKVLSGTVRACKFFYDGRRQINAFHTAGDVFGVEAGTDYSYTAEAVCDCSVISYRRQELDRLTLLDAGLSRQLFFYAMRNLAHAQGHGLLLGRKSAIEKVATFLIDWSEQSSEKGIIVLSMTRKDLADYLGLTIETVSRTLSSLERQGIIGLDSARQIRLVNPAALQGMQS
ncbi:helix-turn-helix domain-containing protein (plasmid) [Lichenicola cladoniae]|uniref:Helix-turn-helix domain-containing protein n=1 Tax=Lichenicola cladoniae TaxID=1484109 RepID=A0A6M8HY66_9PROT|nr:helix-turn-helix domain-containing protein [Lichenicola cladoniae]NPD66805.1 helix-turn-helix domain-containing protein [Acetobacteraceae bacterium]QKE93499.1 helix-turn-helix domain-containing protein [Lichenicola cladoniae]